MTFEDAIKKQVEILRQFYKINIYPQEVNRMCIECNIENMKFADINNQPNTKINLLRIIFIPTNSIQLFVIYLPTNRTSH